MKCIFQDTEKGGKPKKKLGGLDAPSKKEETMAHQQRMLTENKNGVDQEGSGSRRIKNKKKPKKKT